MARKIKQRPIRGCSGKVLVELLLVTPILLMIPAGVMEYARFLRLDQIAVVYSQEAANRAYRQCADFYVTKPADPNTPVSEFNLDDSKAATLACIQNVRTVTNTSMQAYLPGSQIILSVYRYNFDVGATPPTNTLTQVAIIPDQASAVGYSKTLVGLGESGTILQREAPRTGKIISTTEVATRERIVVAEVTFLYRPVLPLFRVFLNAASLTTNGVFRETTIL